MITQPRDEQLEKCGLVKEIIFRYISEPLGMILKYLTPNQKMTLKYIELNNFWSNAAILDQYHSLRP